MTANRKGSGNSTNDSGALIGQSGALPNAETMDSACARASAFWPGCSAHADDLAMWLDESDDSLG